MSASKPGERDRLALYWFPGCPYCDSVLEVIDRLRLDVELRDIHADPRHRAELLEARRDDMVPVLRLSTPGGEVRFLPESRDIVRYLESTYG